MTTTTPTRYPLIFGPDRGDLIDPRWLRNRTHREPAAVTKLMGSIGVIYHEGEVLWFPENGIKPLAIGSEVLISVGSPAIYCELVSEVKAEDAYFNQVEVALAAKVRANLDRLREEAILFNMTLKLPFKWQPGIKMVRSGLSVNSGGSGRNKATVVHITLLEPFKASRFVRFYGDFLCTPGKASIGSHWDGKPEESMDADGNRYPSEITCATCLRNAKSLMKRMA